MRVSVCVCFWLNGIFILVLDKMRRLSSAEGKARKGGEHKIGDTNVTKPFNQLRLDSGRHKLNIKYLAVSW